MDLSNRPELAYLGELAGVIHSGLGNTSWLVIGATARDLLMQYGHGIQVRRATDDIDLAIAVEDWSHFHRVRQQLLDSDAFEEVPGVVHQLRSEVGIRFDLIPFGGVERENGTIAWPPDGTPELTVGGFTEALENAQTVFLPGNQRIRVISLPMLVHMKIIASAERHLRRPGVDLSDVVFILANYLECGHRQRLFEDENDLLDTPDFDYQLAGAILAGRDLGRIWVAADSTRQIEALKTILLPQIADDRPGPLLSQLPAPQLEQSAQLLESFLHGLAGTLKNDQR
ncbi:nucleotidyl transferase AbiEii/AbiGii toxin family protein [Wenzhouxiangella marina]|uniref:Uncharacterized protein n=1 Tax=Wenzhouxiangella marina TaxID=1579979 RepID=A0A0K0XZV7_9GAMM|nr:nucleotidyl transferase AbiEii/AbiGii toxin family protein [Wenzhouxiangella marina]AKS43209.1 hypothetical protein WM2015_2852 [Wenzhouxiangella marina]MBB6087105.1 putative nucleotidyltransferase [Wenzhouxiangella marina]